MITIIDGDSAMYAAAAYGTPHMADMVGLQQRAQQRLTNYDPWVVEYVNTQQPTVFNTYNYERVIQLAKSMNRQQDQLWYSDIIKPLKTTQEVQAAPNCMIEFIMACPTLRRMYKNQEIAAYDKEYKDLCSSDGVGEDHYFYRIVKEGVLEKNEVGEYTATEWFDELLLPEHKLSLIDQTAIMDTWETALEALALGIEDPTSRFGAQL